VRRYIDLEADSPLVIVRAPTGIVYEHEYGGEMHLRSQVEGYLVPLDGDAAELRAAVAEGRTEQALQETIFTASAHTTEGMSFVDRVPLVLDESGGDPLEAWVPVLTPDGPGVLVWGNTRP
jgi:hypothetical protein